MNNIFDREVTNGLIHRLENIGPLSKPLWGTMSADQMFAHCNVPYEMVFEPSKFKRPNAFFRFLIQLVAKNQVIGNKPYPKNGRTAPDFVITSQRNFEEEKIKLIQFLTKTADLGTEYFEGKESHALGRLSSKEWSILFYKHLDHHLNQFDV